jgi:drug/metabolite transporter (DMT)-like permease
MTAPAARPALWMLFGAFAFAAMGALTSALGTRCDWLQIALVRALFMFAFSAILARSAGVRLAVWNPPTLWLRSLAGSFSLVCNFFALTRLPVAEVLTLTNAYPLWIVVLSAFLLRQSPAFSEVVGVVSGLLGVVLIQRPHLGSDRLAAAVALVSSVSTALAMIGLHRLKGIDTRAVVAHFAGVASLVAGTWLALRWRTIAPARPDLTTWVMLLGVGLTGTVGQFFLTKAYAAGVPAKVAVVSLTQVVFGMAFDVAFWGRALTPLGLVGFGLVLAPVAWLTSRPRQGGGQTSGCAESADTSARREFQRILKPTGLSADPEDTAA